MAVKAEINKAGLILPDLSTAYNPQRERLHLGFDMLINPIVICEVVFYISTIN
jgi:hypothetical protein